MLWYSTNYLLAKLGVVLPSYEDRLFITAHAKLFLPLLYHTSIFVHVLYPYPKFMSSGGDTPSFSIFHGASVSETSILICNSVL